MSSAVSSIVAMLCSVLLAHNITLGPELACHYPQLYFLSQHAHALFVSKQTCVRRRRSMLSDTFYIAYSTAQQVVGVMAWPLNGDPATSLGLIAHPGPVVGMNLSHDGCKLITAGHDDGSVMVWQVLPPQGFSIT